MTTQESMIAQLLNETVLTAAEAARRSGVTVAAVVRWIRRGKPLAGNARRKLEGYQSGRTWMTSVEALARFHASSPRAQQPAPYISAHRMARRVKAGRAALDRATRRLTATA